MRLSAPWRRFDPAAERIHSNLCTSTSKHCPRHRRSAIPPAASAILLSGHIGIWKTWRQRMEPRFSISPETCRVDPCRRREPRRARGSRRKRKEKILKSSLRGPRVLRGAWARGRLLGLRRSELAGSHNTTRFCTRDERFHLQRPAAYATSGSCDSRSRERQSRRPRRRPRLSHRDRPRY